MRHANDDLFVASQYGSVRLAKHFSRVSVSWISITMPMTSGTESSANSHISLSYVPNITIQPRTIQYEQQEYIVPHMNHIFNDTYQMFIHGLLYQIMNTLGMPSYMIVSRAYSQQLNTLRTLSSGHGIELGCFSRVQNHMNPNVEPGFPKVILQRFFKKFLMIGHQNAPFVSLKSWCSPEDVQVQQCSEMRWLRPK